MTSITITAEHLTSALSAANGAIFLTPTGTVEAGSLLYPQGEVLALASDLGYWVSETDTLDEAAEALTIQIRNNLANEA